MKVMQLLPDLNQGGVERGTLDISKALIEAGHQSVVVSGGGRLVAELETTGARHLTLPIGRKAFATFFIWFALLKLLKQERPDIVHLRSRLPAWVFWAAYWFLPLGLRPKVISTLHGMNSVSKYSRIMLRGDHRIAVSQTCLDYWQDNYPDTPIAPSSIIYRGIDTDFFKPTPSDLRSELGANDSTLVIAFPGRITPWKGHRDLVKIAQDLNQQQLDFQVWVIGEGKPGSQFETEIRAAAPSQVKFLGHRSDMPAVLTAADVTLSLTSTTMESFGRVPVESIACGTPVIAFDHGAVGETMRALQPDGLVQVGDVDAVVQKLNHLPSLPATVEPFTLQQMRQQTLDLYQAMDSRPILEVVAAWGNGGLEAHFVSLVNGIAESGRAVTALVPNECDGEFHSDVTVVRHNFKSSRYSLGSNRRLVKLLEDIAPKVIHCHAGKASSLFSKVAGKLRIPLVSTVHNQKSSTRPYRRADRVIGVSQRLADWAGSRGVRVYNGLDIAPHLGAPKKTDRWLAVGRLVEAKGFDMLIRAVAGTDVKVDIAGDGPEQSKLEALISQYGLSDQVQLLGNVPDVRSRMRDYQGVVVSSRREGFSYAVAEALLQKVPVISTRVPVADEVLSDQFLCDVDSEQKLRVLLLSAAERVEQLRADQTEYFEFALQHFTRDSMVADTLRTFDQLTDKN